MPAATITSKGQTTVPKEVRDALHLRSGDRLEFVLREGEVLLMPAALDVKGLKGLLRHEGKRPISIEEMKKAVRKHLGGKRRR